MRANRSRDTLPELQLRSELHRRGLRYRVNDRPVKGLRRSADLVFRKARVVVYVDGCFWHGCPTHFIQPKANGAYWAQKIDRNRRRDVETDEILLANGWHIVRVWEHDDPTEGAERVLAAVVASLDRRH
jgi:DNA mismatch endonuclease, patch repair protein